MNASRTAVLLIGFQKDYFDSDGILRGVLEDHGRVDGVRERTIRFAQKAVEAGALVISTPIVFQPGYPELVDPVGILKSIRDMGAFQDGTKGGDMIDDLGEVEGLIVVPGKRGLNAFSSTSLDDTLREHGVNQIIMAGVVTSICIDSTARSGFDRGFSVTVLSDCTAGRTAFEQDFYCREVFPLYASVRTSDEVMAEIGG